MKEQDVIYNFFRQTVIRQLYYCENKDYYKAGIYVSENSTLFFDMLDNLVEDNCRKVLRARKSKDDYEVFFTNGSCIHLLNATQGARGRKFHDLIIDTKIKNEIKDFVCYPTLVRYILEYDSLECDGVDIRSRCVELRMR